MTIIVNEAMAEQIAGEDPWDDSSLTFSLNVDPGILLSEVLEGLFLGGFEPQLSSISGNTVSGDVAAVLMAFELWDDLIAASLTYAPDDGGADITVNNVTNLPSFSGGRTYSTLDTVLPNDVDIFLTGVPITPGQPGFMYIVHEIGHGLGLSHPGDYNASPDTLTYANDRTYDEDTAQFTVMSYFEPSNYPGGGTWFRSQVLTPMIYDILAIQYLYGRDTTTRTGDTTYGFNHSADVNRSVFVFSVGAAPVLTIWDAGGRDRLDVSGYGDNQLIDLSEGSYSNVGGLIQNVGIAFGTFIEEASTGSGNDLLFGNDLDNRLDAGLNNDAMYGGTGRDTLIGGAGNSLTGSQTDNDQLFGGADSDRLIGGFGADIMFGGAGFDTAVYNATVGETITITPRGKIENGSWRVAGPAQATGDELKEIEAFAFGEGSDNITVENDRFARALSVEGLGGNDTIRAIGTDIDSYTLFGGAGTDILQVGTSKFFAAGGYILASGGQPVWIESFADNDQLTIDRKGLDINYDFTLFAGFLSLNSGLYFGSDGSQARGFNRISYTGSEGVDRVDGAKGNDTLDGGGGTDFLTGYTGDDSITGGDGTDNLQGGEGNDSLYGGAGRDGLSGDAGDDLIFTGGGLDVVVFGGAGNDTLAGSDDSETMNGDDGDDVLQGFKGNDSLNAGRGNAWVRGDEGDDTIVVDGGRIEVYGGDGRDELVFSRATLTTDLVFQLNRGVASDGSLARGIELFRFAGGSGHENITGGDLGSNFLNGFFGNDTLTGGDLVDNLQGGEGNDVIAGGLGRDDLYGGAGNDRIDTGGGLDVIVQGEAGNDTLTGSADAETMSGGGDQDLIDAGGGNDSLLGDDGNDTIYGGDGNDRIDAGLGFDQVFGGAGIDELTINRSTTTAGATYALNRKAGSDGSRGDGIEVFRYSGGSGDDRVTGGDLGSNFVNGNGGNDTLTGGVSLDNLQGGAGDDVLSGGAGRDDLFGGIGNDRIDTGGGNDVNVLGEAGNDTLNGSADAETMGGGGDQDLLRGREGQDSLSGGDGDDTIIGGTGNDRMDGDTGADVFVLAAGDGVDLITGFDADPAGGQDRLDVSAYGFGSFAGMLAAGVTISAGVGTVITFVPGTSVVTLSGVAVGVIDAGDFIF